MRTHVRFAVFGLLQVNAVYTKKAWSAGRSQRPKRHASPLFGDEKDVHNKARKNASRDMHRRFTKFGLSLPVPINRVHHQVATGDVTTHWVKPSDWLKVLMARAPWCLLGDCSDPCLQLRSFWSLYKLSCPGHEIFKHRSQELGCVLPVALFGDEGRGPKRGKFLVWSVESVIGVKNSPSDSCECSSEARRMAEASVCMDMPGSGSSQAVPVELLNCAATQGTNYKGHSFLTRHLLLGFPGWVFEDPQVIDKHLELIASDLESLFWDGFTLPSGEKFYAALVAVKGDMKHMVQMGIERSYHKLQQGMMCSLCEAGASSFDLVPFEDSNDEPRWAATMGKSRPWTTEPLLCTIPHVTDIPEQRFALDIFHVFKVGVARDICGSMIYVMAMLKFFVPRTKLNLVKFLVFPALLVMCV